MIPFVVGTGHALSFTQIGTVGDRPNEKTPENRGYFVKTETYCYVINEFPIEE